ncbi:glycosyltransferase family A protein [uncultured Oscillibacter sp.]|jgi:glycosyltransferase involved in cell wall biosynthesis|uniref:glycosyltransferase family 2 protein n=1 Tax=uncultured Oscillibacter sp. TaxID=876091 RepID=UPI0025F587BB|nr:glycosyltransferase family A protein [uncultured Oscillibacter sp.]
MRNYVGVRDRVSVVTPVYNGERHLHRLLRSILAQTWDHLEMILVDDGSQDRTVETAQEFQAQFQARGFSFQIVRAEHRNASAAINRGLPLVTGEFLIWPDSDDELEPDSIRRRVEFLRANPQYQCVRSLSRYRYEDGSTARPQEKKGCLEEENLFFPILLNRSFVCCGCYMLRLEAFFSIYPQRKIPEYDVGQNFQMLLPFMYRHPCPTIREELYTVYVRPNSHSHRVLTQQEDEKKYADFEALVDELAAVCPINNPTERMQIKRWKWSRRYELYRRYNRKRRARIALCWLFWHGGFIR